MDSHDLERYFASLKNLLAAAEDDKQLFEVIVNAPFHDKLQTTMLDLGIAVLLLANPKSGSIDRVALSNTEPADWSVRMTPVPFHEIKIPLDNKINIISKAIAEAKPQMTTDWRYLFTPALSAEAARFNQAGAGIACSHVYPLIGARDGGAMIFSFYQPPDQLKSRHIEFMRAYSQLVAEALSK